MTPAQIYNLIETTKSCCVQILDYSNNKLHDMVEMTPQAAVIALERDIIKFSGYKKVQIKARGDVNTPLTKAYVWQLEFLPEDENAKRIAAPGAQAGIGVMDYLKLHTEMTEKNFALQKDLLEKTQQMNNNDPTKWIGAFQAVAPYFGMQPSGIAGPPGLVAETKKELHLMDVDYSKLSGDELGQKINTQLLSLNKKISGPQMLKILVLLDSNENITANADKIATLLDALNKGPELIDQALKFISN